MSRPASTLRPDTSPKATWSLAMSAYDRAATALISMLLLAGVLVGVMFVMVMDAGISAGMKDIQLAVQESP